MVSHILAIEKPKKKSIQNREHDPQVIAQAFAILSHFIHLLALKEWFNLTLLCHASKFLIFRLILYSSLLLLSSFLFLLYFLYLTLSHTFFFFFFFFFLSPFSFLLSHTFFLFFLHLFFLHLFLLPTFLSLLFFLSFYFSFLNFFSCEFTKVSNGYLQISQIIYGAPQEICQVCIIFLSLLPSLFSFQISKNQHTTFSKSSFTTRLIHPLARFF
jgi:hypothetical protein